MVGPASPSPSPSLPPPPSAWNNSPPLWFILCVILFAFALLFLYNKLTTGKWINNDPPRQHPQRGRAGHAPAPAPLTRVVVQTRRKTNALNSFTYKGDNGCAVCLCVFEEGEQVKQIPKCQHCFHARCIDTWLGDHDDCPLCRSVVAPPVV